MTVPVTPDDSTPTTDEVPDIVEASQPTAPPPPDEQEDDAGLILPVLPTGAGPLGTGGPMPVVLPPRA